MTSAYPSRAPRPVARLALVLLLAAAAAPAAAQEAPAKIRDNLFLLEEAYNQEPGVVQHIQSTVWNPRLRTWTYGVTDEWPAPSDLHQLSLTVPASGAAGSSSQLGDVLLNYRLQAVGAGGAGRLAVAPRLSLVLPTQRARGSRGVLGLQFNLPVSIELNDRFVAHLNAGGTLTPGSHAAGGQQVTTFDSAVGGALVWLAAPRLNAVLEVLHATSDILHDDGRRQREGTLTLNPGLRWAMNFRSGLQVVPGVSVPIQFPAGGGRYSLLAYLSLEHPLWKAGR